jgi:general secretion pathway protein G
MDNLYNRVAARRRHGQGGFTLIELLVVIAILAILAFIVIFNVTGVTNRGNSSACVTDGRSVQTGLDAYINDSATNGDITTADAAINTAAAFGTANHVSIKPSTTDAGSSAPTNAFWKLIVPAYVHNVMSASDCTSVELAFANGTNASNGYSVNATP